MADGRHLIVTLLMAMLATPVPGVARAQSAANTPATANAPATQGAPSAPQPVLGPLEAAIQSALVRPVPQVRTMPYPGEAEDLAALGAFYAARAYAPLWTERDALSAKAGRLISELAAADDWGLSAADFQLPPLKPGIPAVSTGLLADGEIALSRAALKYARFARGGRIPDPAGLLSGFIDRKPQIVAPQQELADLAAAADPAAQLRGLHPQHPQFEALRRALVKARAESDRAPARLPAGPVLAPGRAHPQIALLRSRLGLAAPADATAATFYDRELETAVKAFQVKNGLKPDGQVGSRTRGVLNGDGATSPVATIVANMEAWRWMPASLGATYVLVNVPEYEMRLVRNGEVVHRERVITGRTETATPLFTADMQTIVFQPKWGVPNSIKVNEFLPRLAQGRGMRAGFRISLNGRDINPYSVDWSRADITRYHIYQESGDDNALGVVKFLFPNKHSVYMHDTPSKGLFNAASRSYSHGCVRLRNPVRLAELVLGSDKNWAPQAVRDLIERGPEDNAIKLDQRIPVHIAYFTAEADASGHVKRFPDVYGHERRITLALQGRTDQIVRLDPQPVEVKPIAGQSRYAASAEDGQGLFGIDATGPTSKNGGGSYQRFRGDTVNDLIMRQLYNGN